MPDWLEIALRLGLATISGGAIGLNRDLHGKPIGLRTLALMGLATSMVVVLADPHGGMKLSDAVSRVVQGVLTGVGFLGAGVILHRDNHPRVRGLTSAASAWLTACIGIVCGAGQWHIVAIGLALAFLVLMFGGRLERVAHRALGGKISHNAEAANIAPSEQADD